MRKLIVYMPVLHQGYLNLLEVAGENEVLEILIIDPAMCSSITGHDRDFAIDPNLMVDVVSNLKHSSTVRVLTRECLAELKQGTPIMATDHALARYLLEPLVTERDLEITWLSTFVRWDMPRALSQVPPTSCRKATTEEVNLMEQALSLSGRSPDSFRQVAALAVRDGIVIASAYNYHMPFADSNYTRGDPSAWRNAGENLQVSSALHAEQALIATQGRPDFAGADIYVSTFPCPTCAGLIACAGFRRVFFSEGYSVLTAADTLKAAGIEIIHVPKT